MKIYLSRILNISCLLLLIARLIYLFTVKDANGIGLLMAIIFHLLLLALYLILTWYSFSFIGKNNPLSLLLISLLPAILYFCMS